MDRRTFIKGSLVAGGLLAGGGAADRRAGRRRRASRRPPETAAARLTCAGAREDRRTRRPNILVIIVDQLRYPQWFAAAARRAGVHAQPRAPAPRSGLLRAPLHRVERLHARPLDAADRPLHPPDRMHDHRREHARSGLPHLGNDAARARLPHLVVRQVAPDPPRQPLDAGAGGPALERYGFSGGTFPSPDGAPGQGWRVDPHITTAVRAVARTRRAPTSRGARRCRSSTPTTSPGGTRGAIAYAPRRRAASVVQPSARRTSRRPELRSSAASPGCSAPSRKPRPPPSGRSPSRGPDATREWLNS